MTAMSRRRLLSLGAKLAGGITVFAALPACAALNPLPALPTRGGPEQGQSITWLHRAADGRLRLFLPRQEMGQGVAVALRQIVAAEMDVPLAQVEAVAPSTDDIAPVRATVGSDSMKDFARPVARAAALLREHLAAGGGGGKIEDRGQAVVLRSLEQRHRIGEAAPEASLGAIVTGQPLYAGDVRLPGMRFGLVLPRGASAPAGVQTVALSDGRLGLLSERAAALHGLALTPPDSPRAMPEFNSIPDRLEHKLRSDTMPSAPWTLDRQYSVPFAAHAGIETRSAVARWNKDGGKKLEVWTGSQDIFFVRETLARQFGLSKDDVRVQACRMGGAFGARTIVRAELDAALLSQAAGGRPVKVQMSRQAEFTEGFHRPPSLHRIRAKLDHQGRITDWWHGFLSGHVIFTSAAMPRWMQAVTSFVADPGVARGALPPYAFPRQRVEFSDIRMPVDTGPWRGLGAGPNGFAIEAAMDELARLANRDPVAFRLDHLGPDRARLAACLRRAAELAGPPVPGAQNSRMGRGVACGIYKDHAYAAVIADMAVNAAGEARAVRVSCAQDCGPVINPDQVRAQIEGNLVWGLGMTLIEALPIEAGRVAAYTFADYPIPAITHMPEIRIALLEPEGTSPGGAGETAMVGAAAFANGIAAVTGKAVTHLPYRA